MFEKIEIFRLASASARHAASRQALISENIAHADTPGFRARDVGSFDASFADQGVALRHSHPAHITTAQPATRAAMFDVQGVSSPNGNSVDLEDQMVRSVEAKRQHDRALAVYKSSIRVLRTALGRG